MVIAYSFGWALYDSLQICWQSHNDGPKIYPRYSLSYEILSLNDTSTLFLHCFSPFLPIFLSFWWCITIRPKSLSVDDSYSVTLGQSWSWQNFTDSTSNSDSRQNCWLWLTPNRASTLDSTALSNGHLSMGRGSHTQYCSLNSVGQTVGSRARNSWANTSSECAESCPYKGMQAIISSIY